MKKNYQIGVKDFVSFLFQSGDLSSELFQNAQMLEGIKAHQTVQKNYSQEDQKEVSISYTFTLEGATITLNGRVDGLLLKEGIYTVDEIKSTRQALDDEAFTIRLEHVAQLKVYAFMLMQELHLATIEGRLTYVELVNYSTKIIEYSFEIEALHEFMQDALKRYLVWVRMLESHGIKRMASQKTFRFPYPNYREGQKSFMHAVYETVKDKEVLYAMAPTGIGKTLATLFSSLKAMDDPMQKLFYLTAKTSLKRLAIDAMIQLKSTGLVAKTLEITAKDTICFLEKRDCDPEKCPYAKGFFDRLSEATVDIFIHEGLMTREIVESYAKKHEVCPFEFSLYVSYFVDVIICDYNYVFDPRTHLIRYFDEVTYKPIVLVDEAHNLVSRSREMYSASLFSDTLVALRRLNNKRKPSIRASVKKVIDIMKHYQSPDNRGIMVTEHPGESFIEAIYQLNTKIEKLLRDNPKFPERIAVLEGYFELLNFHKMLSYYGPMYVTIWENHSSSYSVTLKCLDARLFLKKTVTESIQSTVFFSATLHPLSYYQTLLTDGLGETLSLPSPFDSNRLGIFTVQHVSTRYQDRPHTLHTIKEIIDTTINARRGNYIVFFPSYAYLDQVRKLYVDDSHLLVQRPMMSLVEQEAMLAQLTPNPETSRIAFFVLGGMFSEGIDYVGDMLNGVIVIGVGLPMVNEVQDLLRQYFDDVFQKGFDYAYVYPGMNKVIQAVGRVIRTEQDYGIAVLVDDRFGKRPYKDLFLSHWTRKKQVSKDHLNDALSTFFFDFDKE